LAPSKLTGQSVPRREPDQTAAAGGGGRESEIKNGTEPPRKEVKNAGTFLGLQQAPAGGVVPAIQQRVICIHGGGRVRRRTRKETRDEIHGVCVSEGNRLEMNPAAAKPRTAASTTARSAMLPPWGPISGHASSPIGSTLLLPVSVEEKGREGRGEERRDRGHGAQCVCEDARRGGWRAETCGRQRDEARVTRRWREAGARAEQRLAAARAGRVKNSKWEASVQK